MKPFRMLIRSFRDAFKSVFRNFSLSLASISCITITLIIVAISILVSLNVKNITKVIKEDVTIVVFVSNDSGVTANQIEAKLEMIDNVADIKYVSREQSRKIFEDSSNILKSVMEEWTEEENPLEDSFEVKVKDVEQIETTAKIIENLEGIDCINYGKTWVNDFLEAFKIIEKGTVIAVIALIIVTVFLIINTIKLTIFSRKREISIMRLVGASNITIKMPFVIEGMVLGIIGSIIPILIVIYGYFAFYENLGGQLYSPLLKLTEPEPFIYLVSLAVLVIGIIVGMIGSYKAVKKYLKV